MVIIDHKHYGYGIYVWNTQTSRTMIIDNVSNIKDMVCIWKKQILTSIILDDT